MADFNREERYTVIKKSTGKQVDCVVIEADWPEYEFVWQMLKDRVDGCENQVDRLKAELEAARKDAESWRSYKKRKDEVIAAGMGRNVLREAAIEQAKSCNELHEKGS